MNNAAVAGAPEPFWQHDPDEWWHVFEVNVLGPYLCCHAVLPGMVERRRGRIVNVTSGAAFVRTLPSNARDTSYPPSKAALTRFTEGSRRRSQSTASSSSPASGANRDRC